MNKKSKPKPEKTVNKVERPKGMVGSMHWGAPDKENIMKNSNFSDRRPQTGYKYMQARE